MIRKSFYSLLIVCILLQDCAAVMNHQSSLVSAMEEKLKRLGVSLKSISKMKSGDKTIFQSMDNREFQKLTPDLIADIGQKAIQNLNNDQIKMMSKNLYKGNEEHLGKIFSALNKEQLTRMIESMQNTYRNSSEQTHLNCVQFEPLIKALKRTSGPASSWNKDIFDKLGSAFVQCLSPTDLKNVAGNKDAFRTVLQTVNKAGNHKAMSRVEKKSLLQGATTAFGAMKDWTTEHLKSASSLVTMFKPKELKQLDTGAIKSAIQDLGKQTWAEKRGKQLVAKLKDPSQGFGEINTWSAETIDSLGNLRGSLSKKELGQISNETLRRSVQAFGRTPLPLYKKRVLSDRLKKLYGKPKNWTSSHIQNASELLGGMEIKDLEEMDDDALVQALPSVKNIELPRHKGRVLAKKIQRNIGDVRYWNLTVVKKIGPLVKDLPETMLEMLQPDEAREAVKMLRNRKDVSTSKKRVLIEQALKTGGQTSKLPVKEFGDFVAEFPLTELKSINNIDELLPDESYTNGSVESEAMWNPSQARSLIKDLVTSKNNWGPVSQSNELWNIGNIKKLGRLGLGLRKSDLANLNRESYPDFAAEFSRILNWTIGQAKTISDKFMEFFENRESDITVTEITSLGDFVINIMDTPLKKLSKDTQTGALRQMGASRLYQRLPKILQQTKTKTALEVLGKEPSSLTGEELEDLGGLVRGLKNEDIERISSSAFTDAVVLFGDIEDLDKEISKLLARKAVEAFGGASAFDGDILNDLGHLVEGLESKDVADIPNNVINENLHIFAEASLEADVAKTIVEKIGSSRRKRRAVDMASKTAAELIEMGSTLLGLTKDQILTITNEVFSSVVGEISEIKGFTTDQLNAWASKAKSAWGSVGSFTEDQLLQLNEFAKGFSGDELKLMSFDSNEVIESFGRVTGYSQDQLVKMWEKIKTRKGIASFTGDDLKSLGVIALALTGTDIGQINAVAYQNAALELGQLQGWSSDQTKSLKSKAVETFGAVSSWSSAQISLAGAAIGGFTAPELQSINADQLDAIKPSVIKQIPAEIFKELSVAQLSQLSSEQASAVTAAQRAVLSSEQKETLLKVETDSLRYTSGSCACAITECSYLALGATVVTHFSHWLQ